MRCVYPNCLNPAVSDTEPVIHEGMYLCEAHALEYSELWLQTYQGQWALAAIQFHDLAQKIRAALPRPLRWLIP